MIDAILHVPDFATLVGYLDVNHPEMLVRDGDDNMAMPPVVTGFARTPAVVNGNAILVYARLREDEVAQWDGMPGVDVLAQAEYTGKETSAEVYAALFSDPDATAKYDGVYDRTPREVDDGEGGVITVTPPAKFGVMA